MFLHLNYSYSTISLSLFLYHHAHQQSTTSLVHSNMTSLPHKSATMMMLPAHPPMPLPSSPRPHDNHYQILFLPSPRPQLHSHLSLRANLACQRTIMIYGSNQLDKPPLKRMKPQFKHPFHQNMRITYLVIYFSQLKVSYLFFISTIRFSNQDK